MANEAGSAEAFVAEVLSHCSELRDVAFYAVLDRVSQDGTKQLLERLAARDSRLRVVWSPHNRCVVDAYLRGYREALASGHDYILEIDAGYSHSPSDIPKFLDAMERGHDCVFATRFSAGGRIRNSSMARRVISWGGTVLSNALLGTQLTDMTSGFELFSRSSLELVLERGIRSRAHFFQTEIKYHCRGMNVAEVPITYRSASASVEAASLADAFGNLLALTKLRWTGGQRA